MKVRVDQLLVKKGFFESREKAKRAIISGIVYIDGYNSLKPGTQVEEDVNILVKDKNLLFPYVSRGGLKLEKALLEFKISVADKVALDVGASTGGFTDCLLQFGARKVYAVDVGYGQLDWKLRNDRRVIVKERINARHLTDTIIPEKIDIVTIDVSFISVKKILPSISVFLKDEGNIVLLIKPQFEAKREEVKRGIIRDPLIHKRVSYEIVYYCKELALSPLGFIWSPIKGPKGNIEFLLWCKKGIFGTLNIFNMIEKKVEEAHRILD